LITARGLFSAPPADAVRGCKMQARMIESVGNPVKEISFSVV
jgi:hypothetical protein